MTLKEAKLLTYGDRLHFSSDGHHCDNWRVNGKVELWKRSPERIRIPLAYGLYGHGYLTEFNVRAFHKESDCKKEVKIV